jgi:hypothetical protein
MRLSRRRVDKGRRFQPYEAINRKPKKDNACKETHVEKYGNNCWGLAPRISRKDRELLAYSKSQFCQNRSPDKKVSGGETKTNAATEKQESNLFSSQNHDCDLTLCL